jgi:hypothetical protein
LRAGQATHSAVEAKDAAGNVPPKAHLTAATSACVDTTAPTAPGTPTVTGTTSSTISLVWAASIDNVGVAGYDVFVNGSKAGTASATSFVFTGLSCGTNYTLGVDAYDAAGNHSSSATLAAATTACATGSDPVVAAAGDICASATDCAPPASLLELINPTRVLALGDNAYDDGSLSQYMSFYDPKWGRLKAKTSPPETTSTTPPAAPITSPTSAPRPPPPTTPSTSAAGT